MDGLDQFEKTLAAEKEQRERTEKRDSERQDRKKSSHHDRHRSEKSKRDDDRHRRHDDGHRSKHDDGHGSKREDGHKSRHRHHHSRDDKEGHRHKRSRHNEREDDSSGEERIHRKRRHKESDEDEESDASGSEKVETVKPALARDAWMESPSALGLDYKQKKKVEERKPPPPPARVIHNRELNRGLAETDTASDPGNVEAAPDYDFGDEGSSWRMTKLSAVYAAAKQSGRSVGDIAIERFGSLREFDDAREEKEELDRRKLYGAGYKGKSKPTGELYEDRRKKGGQLDEDEGRRPDEDPVEDDDFDPPPAAPALDPTALNRLRAQMMKAKLRGLPEAAKLEAEYNAALNGPSTVVLGPMQSRQLAGTRGEVRTVDTKRGRERGLVEENTDMSIEDMVREERRTRGERGGEGKRLAERIARDAKFDDDLDYLDENASKLAQRVHKTDAALRAGAVDDYHKIQRALDKCPLCHREEGSTAAERAPTAPVVSLATRVYLTLPTEPEVSAGGAVLVPVEHHGNLLECDDDEWEELRNFMKSLTRLYHDQGREVVFYENAVSPPGRYPHAALVAVPIPYELGATAPAFFREAMLSADEEWSQHRKIIDTAKAAREGMGRAAFRRSIAKEMPYFHVWFTLDGGMGHVVEDENRWPKGDLFAREIIGGMVDAPPDVIKRQGRWRKGADEARVEAFRKTWRRFDWTRVLEEGDGAP